MYSCVFHFDSVAPTHSRHCFSLLPSFRIKAVPQQKILTLRQFWSNFPGVSRPSLWPLTRTHCFGAGSVHLCALWLSTTQ
ncbi:hypothetical protein AOQ84DRAFT_73822 [Glonium stellatum]|uniref:Uncharacterized protein n=1 Tax=Glonium stellatum TaxID=574774 RepID=A0A8E2JRC7_9PEZI|nr:hypothetical protein AOQ84DRAFT_73822 [Glonium stellatum]